MWLRNTHSLEHHRRPTSHLRGDEIRDVLLRRVDNQVGAEPLGERAPLLPELSHRDMLNTFLLQPQERHQADRAGSHHKGVFAGAHLGASDRMEAYCTGLGCRGDLIRDAVRHFQKQRGAHQHILTVGP